jgi:hypothetical protein
MHKLELKLPFEGADHVVSEKARCPHCGSTPLKVAGKNQRPSSDDRAWESDGYALCCKLYLGTIRAEAETLFGVREDQAVLNGPWRVY